MKKLLIILVILTYISLPAMAQWDIVIEDNRKAAFNIEIGAGLNLSSFNGQVSGKAFQNKVGASLGAGVEARMLPRNSHSPVEDGLLGIYAGLAYEGTGAKDSQGGNISLNNIGIPLLVRYYMLPSVFIEAGPEFFMNLSISPSTFTIDGATANLSNHKANDIKALIGAGVRLDSFVVGARYMIGTSDFARSLPWKCNVLQIHLSYLIKTGW